MTVNSIKNSRLTCSDRCATIASTRIRTYQNGSRKPTWFYNPNENKKVLLDSSWEVTVAKCLIELDIAWIRPDPMDWIDSNGVNRLYYPDFYLNDYDIYLDPKNPYCMTIDKEKMNTISKACKIYYGDINYVLDVVNSLIPR